MSCPQFEDRLNDYAGGYLSGRARQDVDEHLLICTACREDLKILRELVEDLSSLPQSIEAPAEVWSATKSGLESSSPAASGHASLAEDGLTGSAERSRAGTGGRAGSSVRSHDDIAEAHRVGAAMLSPRRYLRPIPLSVAASILLIVAVAAVVGLRRVGPASGPTVVEGGDLPGGQADGDAGVPGTSGPGSGEIVRVAPAGLEPLDLEATEAEFSRAAANLLAALEAQRDRIPPETLALIEENLLAIDGAITDTHRAMESDPGNARLGRLMRAMYHRKMRLLQGAAVIPSS